MEESSKYKLFAFVFFMICATFLAIMYSGQQDIIGILAIFCIFAVAIIWLCRSIFYPKGYGKTRLRIITVTLALSAIGTYSLWDFAVEMLISTYFPDVKFESFYTVLVTIVIIVFIVFLYTQDNTSMGIHKKSFSQNIPEMNNKKIESICRSICSSLQNIDIQTKWTKEDYIPLEATVAVSHTWLNHSKKMDLLTAIRRSKDGAILVIGPPGSGKSVALRKLCQDLTKEAVRTRKIPLYINLKEWITEFEWSKKTPTVHDLKQFIIDRLTNNDINLGRFFKKYFYELYEKGHLYFVLDSFDEIPAIMNESEKSNLIGEISFVIYKFLEGCGSCQGVLSSRVFRKPTSRFQSKTTMRINPFTEDKVQKAFKERGYLDCLKEIYKNRLDLYSLSQNPFMANLLIEYIEEKRSKDLSHAPPNLLPNNQAELYTSYIEATINDCEDKMKKLNLSKKSIIQSCILIASTMFRQQGLEVSKRKLQEVIKNYPIDKVIEILVYSRLGRVSVGDNRFSFSHRRFCEYFIVQEMLQSTKVENLENIPEDSQWRDALVLYCQVADENSAKEVANFCWNIIKSQQDLKNLRVIHSLRFLKDAFSVRTKCIEHLQEDLGLYLHANINSKHILTQKISVEALSLINDDFVDIQLTSAIISKNTWIQETAFDCCRNKRKISCQLENNLISYIASRNSLFILEKRNSYLFSLGLSKALKSVKLAFVMVLLDTLTFIPSLIFCFFYNYRVTFGMIIIFLSARTILIIMQKIDNFVLEKLKTKKNIYSDKDTEFHEKFDKDIKSKTLKELKAVKKELESKRESVRKKLLISHSRLAAMNSLNNLFSICRICLALALFHYFLFGDPHIKIACIERASIFVPFVLIFGVAPFFWLVVTLFLIFKSNYLRFSIKQILLFIIKLQLFLLITYLIFLFINNYLKPLGIFVLLTLVCYTLIFVVKNIFDYFKYQKFVFQKRVSRKIVAQNLESLSKQLFKDKYLSYLESNILEIDGDWPDEKIFENTESAIFTRLAKLDAKWKKIDN